MEGLAAGVGGILRRVAQIRANPVEIAPPREPLTLHVVIQKLQSNLLLEIHATESTAAMSMLDCQHPPCCAVCLYATQHPTSMSGCKCNSHGAVCLYATQHPISMPANAGDGLGNYFLAA